MAEIIRAVGEVSSVDYSSGTIRAVFVDRQNAVSGELPVLCPGGWGRPNALPVPGDTVVCLFIGEGFSDGVCLGAIYDPDDSMPGTEEQRGIFYEDGSYVYYDRSAQKLVVKAAGGVSLEGNVSITGNLTVSGSVTQGGGA